ncbi:MAG: hypothetical protein JXA68_08100 [Ignavibacteriales bacterium]|nr:hypothetical protein [Ignavibacteriales bacterium]
MDRYLYFSITPEALISSMLPPEDYGNYLAVGTKKRTRGQAIFFEVDPAKIKKHFPLQYIEERCVPHSDGRPKASVYLSIYRVLEHLPIDSLKNLYLTTDDGRVLEIEKTEYTKHHEDKLHLYQEFCPVTPRIASSLNPIEFLKLITDITKPISVPKLVFVELQLDELAHEPQNGNVDNLPYPNIDHLRDCLIGLRKKPDTPTKTVIRFFQGDLLFRTCKNGFFVGDKNKYLYYPFPSLEDLQNKYYSWWRSALTLGFQ